MPLRIYEFSRHLEITNAGGLYGNARPENFPTINDYRNPLIASAMKTMGYVNMFNRGVGQVQADLKENGNPPAEFVVDLVTAFRVKVYDVPKSLNVTSPSQDEAKDANLGQNDAINAVKDAGEYAIVYRCTIPKGTVYVDGVEDNGLESYASEQIIFEEPVYFGDVAKEWHEKLLPNKQNK